MTWLYYYYKSSCNLTGQIMRTKILSILLALIFIAQSSAIHALAANDNTKIAAQYSKQAHEAYNRKDYVNAAMLYEKAYQLTKNSIFRTNAIVAHTNYAYNLLMDEKFDQAIDYCNKLLPKYPKNKKIEEMLSEAYYSRGTDYFYKNRIELAIADLQKSFELGVDKEQKDRAKEALDKLKYASKANPGVSPGIQNTQTSSIPDLLNIMENKIYHKTNSDKSILVRIQKLEQDVFSRTFNDEGILVRVERLKTAITPEYVSQNQSQNLNANNYIPEIFEQSMGRVSIFGKMPIKVYFDSPDTKNYRHYFVDAAKEGFKEWEKASDGIIKFEYTNNPQLADIKVTWQDHFEDYKWQPELKINDLAAEKERMKYQKAGTLVQMGSIAAMIAGSLVGVPVIGGIGVIGNSVASPYLQYKGTNYSQSQPEVKINTLNAYNLPEDRAKAQIKQITMHQVGHALGIYGHSGNPNDIMYSNFTVNSLSERDINTIKEIYKGNNSVKP